MKVCNRLMIIARISGTISLLLLLCGSALAAPASSAGLVDFTKGYKPADDAGGYSLHLGALSGIPNGRQKLGRDGNQIYVITVTKGKEAGLLQVGDVILGVNGKRFKGDVIETWRAAVAEAPERSEDGNLRVIRWRNGAETTLDYFTVTPPPDLTRGETNDVDRKNTYNLGPSGLRGWIHTRPVQQLDASQGRTTATSRQILVTHVGANSSADGVLAVDDVILGVGGKLFTDDARKSFGKAIGEAEKTENKGTLTLTRWRAGVISDVQIKLKVMGSYSDTAPYECPKSQLILDAACKVLEKEPLKGNRWGDINCLALLATGRPEYLPRVREYARSIVPKDLHLEGCDTWGWGYRNLFLCEYYLITRDKEVAPAIQAYTVALAGSQSMYGTFGHGGSSRTTDGKLHGSVPPYGPVNMAGLVANLSIVTGNLCGAKHREIKPAIERASKFFGYYVDKGAIPYGEHMPVPIHENNGKNSIAALLFGLQGNQKAPAQYFAKMATAAYANRECGHTGQGFSYLWSALGANVGGPDAAAAFFKEAAWHFDLVRRCDGSFTYDGGEQYGAGRTDDDTYYGKSSYYGISPTATYVLTYAMPLKKLCITGKYANQGNWLSKTDVAEAIASGRFDVDCKKMSAQKLLAALGDWSPVVRGWAARELAKRPEAAARVPDLMTLAEGPDVHVAQGACEALGYIKDPRALPVFVRLLKHDDRWLRVKAAGALKNMRDIARPVLADMLQAVVDTAEPLQPIVWADPMQLTHGELAAALFDGLLRSSVEGVDRKLLYPAIQAVAWNADGKARSYLVDTFTNALTRQDVQALTSEILAAIKVKAPANTMFGNELPMAGAKVLATYHYVEGVRAIMDYAKSIDAHGSQVRIPILMTLLKSYGTAARDVVPELKELIVQFDTQCRNGNFPANCNTIRVASIEEAIKAIEAATDQPKLRSVRPAQPKTNSRE